MESTTSMKSSALSDATAIVADSGATKTTWQSIDGTFKYNSAGINPLTHPEAAIRDTLKGVANACGDRKVETLFYYGSGCNPAGKRIMNSLLGEYFPEALTNVESDMLGACRALCGCTNGVVGILGTGSNSCIYNGISITRQGCSGGYLLGDEGSAYSIGKQVILNMLRGLLPEEVAHETEQNYNIDRDKLLEKIYSTKSPNRYIASFSQVATMHRDLPIMQSIIRQSLNSFVINQILPLSIIADTKSVYLAGSVAAACQEELQEACNYHGMNIVNIIQSPIEELCKYHSTQPAQAMHNTVGQPDSGKKGCFFSNNK